MEQVTHPIAPVYDKQSKILILGSFPSVKSRETAFFYGHPQNRFWRVVSGVLGVPKNGCQSALQAETAFRANRQDKR